ncbi:hypothetical protein M569_08920 [Genlisea aurea]|uniref:Cytochrome P450 n=1 Tax=Genlisea aurea TaxID=192259 RepID=S8CM82_9LAMI|nr:hypothetical protein M569_08920 [Genlisea aurea]
MEIPSILFLGCLVFLVAFCSWKALNFAYLRPRKLERFLRKQGFKGNRFKFLYGDTKEMRQIFEASKTGSINLDDDIKPRVGGFIAKAIATYGNYCFVWLGPKPSVIINDPEIAKEILTKTETFGKTLLNDRLLRHLVTGVASMKERNGSSTEKF